MTNSYLPEKELTPPVIPPYEIQFHRKEIPDVFDQRGLAHLAAIMRDVKTVAMKGDIIVIRFPIGYERFHKREIEANRQVVEEVMGQWVGQPVQVRIECESQPQPSTVSETRGQYNTYRERVIFAFNAGNLENAQAALQLLRTRRAATPRLSYSLVYIANRVLRRKTKLALFAEAEALDPDNVYALVGHASALAKDKQTTQAWKKFERALQIDQKNAVTLSMYGAALTKNRQPEKACKMLERSLKINRKDAKTWRNYGNALAATGQFERAFDAFEQSLQIERSDARTLSSYGRALAKYGVVFKPNK